MRWILTFLAGVLIGAGGLFAFLRQVPHDIAPASAVLVAPAVTAPAAPAADTLSASLPPAPVVQTDLTDVDLPLKPAQDELAKVPDVTSADAKPAGKLLVPVEGIKYAQITDNFDQPRGKERHHEALDIMAPKGAKVFAVADGKLVKLFNSKPGGLTVYQFDSTETYAYYYAHLDHYADGVKEGMMLKRGDLVGYVGTTGNAAKDAPHLHFAVFELTPAKQWWKGTPIDPYPLLAD